MICRSLVLTTLLSTFLLASLPAAAHEVLKGPHGGRVVEAGTHHIELVVNSMTVDVFVTDANDKVIPIAGYKGIAILTVGGRAQRIDLTAKDDRLSGTSPIALPEQPNGVVQLTTPDGKTSQGRYH